jgi:hypothetical protein
VLFNFLIVEAMVSWIVFIAIIWLAQVVISQPDKVVISELVTHSDIANGYYDYIELFNTGSQVANLEGYYISDSTTNITKCKLKVNRSEFFSMILLLSLIPSIGRYCYSTRTISFNFLSIASRSTLFRC